MGTNNEVLFNNNFQKAVKLYSNDYALIFRDKQITYKELDKISDMVANNLKQKGVKRGDIVGIMTRRSLETIIGIISVLKVGAAFLPIDPQYPKDRIKFMLKDSNVQILITSEEISEALIINRETLIINDNCDIEEKINKINIELHKNDLAYVIYTSGSSGTPKGVMIGHGALMNFINGITKKIAFTSNKRILAVTTICFDIFILETLLPLTKGLTIVIADELEQKNPKYLMDLIEKQKISMLQITPSRVKLLLNYDNALKVLSNIDTIMIGGEQLDNSLLNNIRKISKAKIYNMYGPTETTVWSTIANLTNPCEINIGKEILNTEIYILDDEGKVVPNGEMGEIYIAGEGLALGYLNRDKLTSQKFLKSSFALGGRMYRTGDLGRRIDDRIICIGRADNQVKIRGFRVELEEIEKNILKINKIINVTVVDKIVNDQVCLVAYVVSDNLDEHLIIDSLKNFLPYYMIPSYFVPIKELPLTPNGKIDRNRLSSMDISKQIIGEDSKMPEENMNKIEQEVVTIIKNCSQIHLEGINLRSNLIKIGINSLKFIEIVVKLENAFDIEFDDEDLSEDKFEYIQDISNYIKNKKSHSV